MDPLDPTRFISGPLFLFLFPSLNSPIQTGGEISTKRPTSLPYREHIFKEEEGRGREGKDSPNKNRKEKENQTFLLRSDDKIKSLSQGGGGEYGMGAVGLASSMVPGILYTVPEMQTFPLPRPLLSFSTVLSVVVVVVVFVWSKNSCLATDALFLFSFFPPQVQPSFPPITSFLGPQTNQSISRYYSNPPPSTTCRARCFQLHHVVGFSKYFVVVVAVVLFVCSFIGKGGWGPGRIRTHTVQQRGVS